MTTSLVSILPTSSYKLVKSKQPSEQSCSAVYIERRRVEFERERERESCTSVVDCNNTGYVDWLLILEGLLYLTSFRGDVDAFKFLRQQHEIAGPDPTYNFSDVS